MDGLPRIQTMNRLLIKNFGHDKNDNVVVVLFTEDENELHDLVFFNPTKSLQSKNLIFKAETEEDDPKQLMVYINPFITIETFMEGLRESYEGDIFFSTAARQSYVRATSRSDVQKNYTFDETIKKEEPKFGL